MKSSKFLMGKQSSETKNRESAEFVASTKLHALKIVLTWYFILFAYSDNVYLFSSSRNHHSVDFHARE